jgi:multiple sugar transport system ATP-binding protein
MNFFKGHMRKDGSKLYFDSGYFKLQIPQKRSAAYQKLVDKEVIFGIRPENIYNPDFAPPGVDTEPVEGKVEVTELMGNEIFLYMISGTTNYVARVDPRTTFKMGDKVKLLFNMNLVHIFDPSVDKDNPATIH